jgi:putative sterol carrier protein
MAKSDRVERFFEELSQRGHEPLLDRMDGTGRVEVSEDGHTESWLVAVRGGYVSVSRGDGDVDWVMRAERPALDRIIHGDAGALAALVRGTLTVELRNPDQKFALLTRLFAGPPESRKRWTEDQAGDD